MNKIFVIAGTHEQAKRWIKENLYKRIKAGEVEVSLSNYVIVHDSDILHGRNDPHGVFIGTWRERGDLEEIVEILVLNSTKVNGKTMSKGLEQIRNEILLKSTRPSPINKAIQAAAQRMAHEIDKQVIANLI